MSLKFTLLKVFASSYNHIGIVFSKRIFLFSPVGPFPFPSGYSATSVFISTIESEFEEYFKSYLNIMILFIQMLL